ncbi:MAG: DUF305 domain-containing protein [Candidatus Nanopelagicaceae bacterium]|nr:DUF305 domain-containing protein [Candidatus Nanopelagicaceae bacterium]
MRKFALGILMLFLTACATGSNSNSNYSSNDLMFAAMMVPHHEQAIAMSDLALKNSSNSEVIAMATAIKNAQAPEIEQMNSWGDLDMGSHGGHGMSGMLSDDELKDLESATGGEFDQLFLAGMIKHHEGAIEMAEMVIDSQNTEVSTLANSIIKAQKAEIGKMKELLKR